MFHLIMLPPSDSLCLVYYDLSTPELEVRHTINGPTITDAISKGGLVNGQHHAVLSCDKLYL